MSHQTKAKVYIKGPPFKDLTTVTFQAAGRYETVDNILKADIVVWTGGADIWPGLYGEQPIPGTSWGDRDKLDVKCAEIAYRNGQFLCGICRGAQLLNCVVNGGKLWQDVDGHESSHPAFDCVTGRWLKHGLNSVHHQMCRLTDEAEIVCWSEVSTWRHSQKDNWLLKKYPEGVLRPEKDKDIEVAWYPKTRSFLFQAHPEFGHPPTTAYFFNLLDRYYWNGTPRNEED